MFRARAALFGCFVAVGSLFQFRRLADKWPFLADKLKERRIKIFYGGYIILMADILYGRRISWFERANPF
ncbi:hypothetical protein [Cytobacillus gottheilii]|uniref:hypothetical protein n=1 Tax=Cytobacillus gottheilii TaxID=859144 RepID=UPI002495199B|nr:hypothetical protein [Cytobacillus gottheilii]